MTNLKSPNPNPQQPLSQPAKKEPWGIELRNLRLGYGDTVILERVSDILPAGKISAILGGSGCGKSTLLRHILGLNKPFEGQILLGGKDLFALSALEFRQVRRRMGVLFQDGALLGSLSLAENVALPLVEHTNLSATMIAEVVDYKLSLVGLEKFSSYFPNQLSGGMRKRAGLARAMVMNPPLLLCDEPTSGLDPINSAQMDHLLLSLKEQFSYMTIVVVSHDLQSMRKIADHVLLLNKGRVAFAGSKEELDNCQDEYVRNFLDRKAPLETNVNPISPDVVQALDNWIDTAL